MNLEQLTQEMNRVQMEYASNPTPENLAKMQSEMMRLQQEMLAATAQLMPADIFGADSSLLADAMAAHTEAVDRGLSFSAALGEHFGSVEADSQTIADFIAKHTPHADKVKYLPIGAFLLATHGELYETFAMMADREEWLEAIAEGWEIEAADEGLEMIAALLDGLHTRVFDDEYRKYKSGQEHRLDEDSVEAYNDMLETLGDHLPALAGCAKSCETILAWDLERAGYLARIFAHLGWITETECFDLLEKTAAQIKEAFSCWEEYAVSIMVGRALLFESADSVIDAACELYENRFLTNHPFSDL